MKEKDHQIKRVIGENCGEIDKPFLRKRVFNSSINMQLRINILTEE